MKIAKMVFSILTILSAITAVIVALLFNGDTIEEFSKAGIMFLGFTLLAIVFILLAIMADNAIEIIEGRREIQRGIEK